MSEGAHTLSAALADVEACAAALKAARDDASLRTAWAQATHDLVHAYGATGDLVAAREAVDGLRRAAKKYPRELGPNEGWPAPMSLEDLWASAASFLIGCYTQAGAVASARALLAELETATEGRDFDAPVREIWAGALVAMVTFYSQESGEGLISGLRAGRDLLARLEPIVQRGDEDPRFTEIRLLQSAGDFTGALASAQAWLGSMEGPVHFVPEEAFFVEEYMRQLWADGARALAGGYGAAGLLPDGRVLLDALAIAAQNFPDEPMLRRQWMLGATDMIGWYTQAQELEAAGHLHDELDATVQKYPHLFYSEKNL